MAGSLDSTPSREDFKGSRLGVPFPSNEDEERPEDSDGDEDQVGDGDDGDEDQGHGPEPRSRSGRSWAPSAAVSTGAGWLLGALLWGWVGLPLIQGGPAQVGKVLRAKFTNKAPDGTELP